MYITDDRVYLPYREPMPRGAWMRTREEGGGVAKGARYQADAVGAAKPAAIRRITVNMITCRVKCLAHCLAKQECPNNSPVHFE